MLSCQLVADHPKRLGIGSSFATAVWRIRRMVSWDTPYAAASWRKLSCWARRRTSGQTSGRRRRYRLRGNDTLAWCASMRGKYVGKGKGCCVMAATPRVSNSRIRPPSGPLSLLALVLATAELAWPGMAATPVCQGVVCSSGASSPSSCQADGSRTVPLAVVGWRRCNFRSRLSSVAFCCCVGLAARRRDKLQRSDATRYEICLKRTTPSRTRRAHDCCSESQRVPSRHACSEGTGQMASRTYRHVVVEHTGGPEVMQVVEDALPAPRAGQVRVKILAADVSFSDVNIRRGRYPGAPRPPFTPG